MQLAFKTKGLTKLGFYPFAPNNYKEPILRGAKVSSHVSTAGTIVVEEVHKGHYRCFRITIIIPETIVMQWIPDKEWIYVQNVLKNEFNYSANGMPVHMAANKYNIVYGPPRKNKAILPPGSYELFYAVYPYASLEKKDITGKWVQQPELAEQMILPVSPAMKLTIENLIAGDSPPICRQQYELIITLEFFEKLALSDFQLPDIQGIRYEQAISLYAAYNVICNNIRKKFSIRELAKMVHLSESTLKRGARLLFGESVNEIRYHQQMRTAKELLLEEDLPIKQIGPRIGYNSPISFSVAFKRYFGLKPAVFRSQLKSTEK